MYLLASYPWGPATAHGVGTLTELYVIYMDRWGPRSNGSTFLRLKDGKTESFLGNIYGYDTYSTWSNEAIDA